MNNILYRIRNEKRNVFFYWGYWDRCFHGFPEGDGLCLSDISKSQQYSGVDDQHGNKIFAGDIDSTYGEVLFWKGMFGFDIDERHNFLPLFERMFKSPEIEIIGNIYQK